MFFFTFSQDTTTEFNDILSKVAIFFSQALNGHSYYRLNKQTLICYLDDDFAFEQCKIERCTVNKTIDLNHLSQVFTFPKDFQIFFLFVALFCSFLFVFWLVFVYCYQKSFLTVTNFPELCFKDFKFRT